MYIRNIVMLAASLMLLNTNLLYAHSDKKHEAQTPKPGHAAALGEPGDPKKVSRAVKVVMSDKMRFTPASIQVKQGETIRFVVRNEGKMTHEMVLGTIAELQEHAALMRKFPEMEHDDPNSISVAPGKQAELVWRFTHAGTFDFACLVPGHYEAGMKGQLLVGKP